MLSEIDKDYYCSAGDYLNDKRCLINRDCSSICKCFHRKYPTPEQFKEEYGAEYPDDGAVYLRVVSTESKEKGSWFVVCEGYKDAKKQKYLGTKSQIVCACTPFGCPPKEWRPE